ncbi:MAG TPA: phosphoribosylformylglycinamidine synthase subunit PurQ [Polyangiales bacterium]|nr:phosphoribosylformylglycinamidine synthase subunit PurQ [Polyangiales bacterium]
MKIAVVVFPGSNADFDALHVARDVLGADARYVFHKETSLGDADAVIVPGGFTYGDYLRAGAIACFSPIAAALRSFAERGGPMLGICNGFQILTELGLLPGVLAPNTQLRFECRDVHIRVEARGPFTHTIPEGTVLRLPIAHGLGRYQCDKDTLKRLEQNQQIAFRYCDAEGVVGRGPSVNGSLAEIAGVYNDKRNVLGLMPHPERASEALLGSADGLRLFQALRAHVTGVAA